MNCTPPLSVHPSHLILYITICMLSGNLLITNVNQLFPSSALQDDAVKYARSRQTTLQIFIRFNFVHNVEIVRPLYLEKEVRFSSVSVHLFVRKQTYAKNVQRIFILQDCGLLLWEESIKFWN